MRYNVQSSPGIHWRLVPGPPHTPQSEHACLPESLAEPAARKSALHIRGIFSTLKYCIFILCIGLQMWNLQIQRANCTYFLTSAYKEIHEVQARVVQRSTVSATQGSAKDPTEQTSKRHTSC